MKVNILKKGDKVLNITSDFVAVERKNGEVDILPLLKEDCKFWIDTENIITISYGNNTIETEEIDGITITNF